MDKVLVQLKGGDVHTFDTLGCTIGDIVVLNMDDDIEIGIVIRMYVDTVSVGRVLHVVNVKDALAQWDKAMEIVTQEFITAQYDLIDKAREFFGDDLKASLWLSRPFKSLGDKLPLDVPFEGIILLGGLEHGVFQ